MHSSSKRVSQFVRILLGAMFFVFGLNGFLNFIPQSPPEGTAEMYFAGLIATEYFFPFLKLTEVLIGIALLRNQFVPLSLIILAPITLHIVAYHVFVDFSPFPIVPLLLGLHLYLAWDYRIVYAPLFVGRSS